MSNLASTSTVDPFRLTPDSRFFFSRPAFEQWVNRLNSTPPRDGFVILTGPAGVGKTTWVRQFCEGLPHGSYHLWHCPALSDPEELLRMLASQLDLEVDDDQETVLLDKIKNALSCHQGQHKRGLIVIDDAHELSLEGLISLCHLFRQGGQDNPIWVILSGLSILKNRINDPDLFLYDKYIIDQVSLGPLRPHEAMDYIQHRLSKAGLHKRVQLSVKAFKKIYEFCAGNPQEINRICRELLFQLNLANKKLISEADVEQVTNGSLINLEPEVLPLADKSHDQTGSCTGLVPATAKIVPLCDSRTMSRPLSEDVHGHMAATSGPVVDARVHEIDIHQGATVVPPGTSAGSNRVRITTLAAGYALLLVMLLGFMLFLPQQSPNTGVAVAADNAETSSDKFMMVADGFMNQTYSLKGLANTWPLEAPQAIPLSASYTVPTSDHTQQMQALSGSGHTQAEDTVAYVKHEHAATSVNATVKKRTKSRRSTASTVDRAEIWQALKRVAPDARIDVQGRLVVDLERDTFTEGAYISHPFVEAKLARVAAVLKDADGYQINIVGYSDVGLSSEPTFDDKITTARTAQLAHMLRRHGISKKAIGYQTVYYNEVDPGIFDELDFQYQKFQLVIKRG